MLTNTQITSVQCALYQGTMRSGFLKMFCSKSYWMRNLCSPLIKGLTTSKAAWAAQKVLTH